MQEITTGGLLKRSAKAWENKGKWNSLMQDVYRYALPHRNLYDQGHGVQSKATEGKDRMVGIYDSTAPNSTIKFANRLQGELTPPFQRWASYQPGPLVPAEMKDEVQARLQVVEKKTFASIHVSNFDACINEFYLELAAGTAVLLVMEGDDESPIRFFCPPFATVAIDEGPFGSVDGVFRNHRLPIRLIEQTWEDANIPEALTNQQKQDPTKEAMLHECTYWDPQIKRYWYKVIWDERDGGANVNEVKDDQVHILVERKYQTHPWVVARWIKVSGENQGRGPLMFALPDIKTANAVVALVLKNAAFSVSGVWAAKNDGVINTNNIRIMPGAVIPVGARGNLEPLQFGGNFDVAQLVLEDLRANIRQALFDKGLPEQTGAVRSATEIIARLQELQADIGAPFGRLHHELFVPLFQRINEVLHEKGIIDIPVKINGLTVKLAVTSPLAQAQNLNDLESATNWLELINMFGMAELGANIEEFPSWAADKLGVDRALVRSTEDRDKIQQIVGQQIAAKQGAVPTQDAAGGNNVLPIKQPGGNLPASQLARAA